MDLMALLIALFVVQQTPRPFEEGREARVCGTVLSYRSSSGCDTTLFIADAQERFEVFIPASVRPASLRPWQMVGAQVCAAGRVRLLGQRVILPGQRVIVNVAAPEHLEIIKPSAAVPFGQDAVALCEEGVQAPEVLSERKPEFTAEARRAKVQGAVEMQAVVDQTGSVRDVRIMKSLHPHLDQNAIEALMQWKFKPGTLAGKAVPVVVVVEMTFTLRE